MKTHNKVLAFWMLLVVTHTLVCNGRHSVAEQVFKRKKREHIRQPKRLFRVCKSLYPTYMLKTDE